MKIGIYNRNWNTYGGGEKHMGAIAKYLSGYGTVDLIGHEPFSIPRLEKYLNLDLGHCNSVILSGDSDFVAEHMSINYDLWINGTFRSSAGSKAKHSILFVMFPFLGEPLLNRFWRIFPLKQPAWMQQMFWRKHGFWRTYDLILANSKYTQDWIKLWWEANSDLLLPYVDLTACSSLQEKKKMILSVGRFFVGGHCKKQDIMVRTFKESYDSGACRGWEYHLCGGTHPEPVHQAYLKDIIETAKAYPIFIHPDIKRTNLESLYRESSIFWHAAGYGIDDRRYPDLLEHFGISTVEAMSAGCIPLVIAKGGQKEIVQHGVNGLLWHSLEELKSYTVRVMSDPGYAMGLRKQAIKRASSFSYDVFSDNLLKILKKLF